MFKDTKANKIFMIAVLVVLFIMIAGNKTAKTKKTTFDNIEISDSISIDSISDINIWVDDSLSSANIVYSNKGNGELDVTSKNGKTEVKENLKKRFFLSIDFEDDSSSISLYLPSSMIHDLEIENVSGDINTYNKIEANNISIKTISGDINLLDIYANSINLSTVSGEITTGEIDNLDAVTIKSTSGEISIDGITSKNGTIGNTSGDIEILIADITDDFKLSTISGDIEVRLQNSSSFAANTTSGNIDINNNEIDGNSYNEGNGKFKFKTISGDIEIDY